MAKHLWIGAGLAGIISVGYLWFCGTRKRQSLEVIPPIPDPLLEGVTPTMAPAPVRNDPHQSQAWASTFQRNLVVAGAGAGKTALVVKRVELLISRGVEPSRILLLSFNKDAIQQLIERLNQSLSFEKLAKIFKEWVREPVGPAVGTIHSVAYELNKRLAWKQGCLAPEVVYENGEERRSPFFETFKKVFVRWANEKGPDVREALWCVLEYRRKKTIGKETIEKLLIRELHEPPVHMCSNGVMVRSKAERTLVEYFVKQCIRFEYEMPVKLNKKGFPFRPDFYLPEIDSFIEYQGMWDHANLELRTGYRRKVEEKRKQFEWNRLGGACLELFPVDLRDGSYKAKINAFVEIRRAKKGEVSKTMESALTIKNYLDDVLAKLLLDVSNAMIVNMVTVEETRKSSPGVLHPIYEYAWDLRQQANHDFESKGQIESNSLLARLAQEFEDDPAWARTFWGQFDYLFIDEFQDVHPLLFRFLRSGLESCKFFLIGDDRQAIYRFAGSSPYFIQHLERFFPGTRRYLLKKNYRSNNSVVEVSQQMVPQNRERYVSSRGGTSDVHLIWVDNEFQQASEVLRYVRHHIKDAELLILSRFKPQKADNLANAAYSKLKRAKDKFLSCHSAKGLEADAVLITGLMYDKASRWSFPAKDSDDMPVRVVKQIGFGEEQSEEEARLFYVALSRARDHLFLVANVGSPSPFLKNLKGLKEIRLSHWSAIDTSVTPMAQDT